MNDLKPIAVVFEMEKLFFAGVDALVRGKVHVPQLRPVNAEDILRRKPIDLPGDRVRELFSQRRVMITGAGGTIG